MLIVDFLKKCKFLFVVAFCFFFGLIICFGLIILPFIPVGQFHEMSFVAGTFTGGLAIVLMFILYDK